MYVLYCSWIFHAIIMLIHWGCFFILTMSSRRNVKKWSVPLPLPPHRLCFLESHFILIFFCEQGVQPCSFYMQNKYCKFGQTCKFDHPVGAIRYNASASSLNDMTIAPYMLQSTPPTTLPFPELQPEFVSGPDLDPHLTWTATWNTARDYASFTSWWSSFLGRFFPQEQLVQTKTRTSSPSIWNCIKCCSIIVNVRLRTYFWFSSSRSGKLM